MNEVSRTKIVFYHHFSNRHCIDKYADQRIIYMYCKYIYRMMGSGCIQEGKIALLEYGI